MKRDRMFFDNLIEESNQRYNENPPEIIFDDLGIHHPVEVPLPAKYEKKECKCGIIHRWEERKFEIVDVMIIDGYPPKKLKKCNECKEVLMLQLYKK